MKKNQGLTNAGLFLTIVAVIGIIGLVVWYTKINNVTEEQKVIEPESKIEGNKDDLVFFSVAPGDTISGILNFSGTIKNAYFFEANILVNILDQNKKLLEVGHGTATTEWMTSEPVSFEGSIDLTGLPTGPGYIQIANDNPSDRRDLDKFIYIPIVIGKSQASTSMTYTYKNHGITMELPKGFIPTEEQSEGGPSISITLPNYNHLSYWTDASWWEKYSLPEYIYKGEETIGATTFKVYYTIGKQLIYWFQKGNVGYEFSGQPQKGDPTELLKTFKFVGWAE